MSVLVTQEQDGARPAKAKARIFRTTGANKGIAVKAISCEMLG